MENAEAGDFVRAFFDFMIQEIDRFRPMLAGTI
jgi:hypothetical protein